jgi:hypothetical protein
VKAGQVLAEMMAAHSSLFAIVRQLQGYAAGICIATAVRHERGLFLFESGLGLQTVIEVCC